MNILQGEKKALAAKLRAGLDAAANVLSAQSSVRKVKQPVLEALTARVAALLALSQVRIRVGPFKQSS